MENIKDIYLSKLTRFRNVLQVKTSKCEGASEVFAELLDSIEEKLDLYSTANAVQVLNSTMNINTSVLTNENDEISMAIEHAAWENDIDPNLLRAVIQVESSFRPNAVSGVGAQGLMQLMPGTAKELGVDDPFDPYQNVNGGAAYLEKQINRFQDVRLALAAYNTGPSRIDSLNIADSSNANEYAKISAGVRGYVEKVMSYYNQYSQTNI